MESLFIGLLQFFFMQRERTAHKNINFYKEGEQLENYTKYRLKSSEELASVLEGKDNLFVIACNKCFKEFETVDEPDCDEFLKIAAEQGKTVTGSAKVDFLCNKMHTERKLQDLIPEGTENVVVISCGLGIQTVADLAGKPVIAASNTHKNFLRIYMRSICLRKDMKSLMSLTVRYSKVY